MIDAQAYTEWGNGHRRLLLAAASGCYHTLKDICASAKLTCETYYQYCRNDAGFAAAFKAAREAGEVYAIGIAQDVVYGALTRARDSGEATAAQLDAAFRVLEAHNPARWAKRTRQEHSGPDGGAIPISEVRITVVDP